MREGIVRPLHTPGVYTTPVAFTSAIALDWSIIVEVSDSQKQSINDAFQYVAVPPIPPGGVGMNDAKIQKVYEISSNKRENIHICSKFALVLRSKLSKIDLNGSKLFGRLGGISYLRDKK